MLKHINCNCSLFGLCPGLTTHRSFFVVVVEVSLGVGWWGWALIRGWALINFFYLQGGHLFEMGVYSRYRWALRNRTDYTMLKGVQQFVFSRGLPGGGCVET